MSDKKEYFVPAGSPVYPDKFDTRVRLRSLTLGLLKPEDVEKHLESLPDEAANADIVDFNSIVENEEAVASASEEKSARVSAEPALQQEIPEPIAATESYVAPVAQASHVESESSASEAASESEETPRSNELEIPTVVPPSDTPDFD